LEIEEGLAQLKLDDADDLLQMLKEADTDNSG
jgi:hypothetical protein